MTKYCKMKSECKRDCTMGTCHERRRSLWVKHATQTRRLCVKCNSPQQQVSFSGILSFSPICFVATLFFFQWKFLRLCCLTKLFHSRDHSAVTQETTGSQNGSYGHSKWIKISDILVLIAKCRSHFPMTLVQLHAHGKHVYRWSDNSKTKNKWKTFPTKLLPFQVAQLTIVKKRSHNRVICSHWAWKHVALNTVNATNVSKISIKRLIQFHVFKHWTADVKKKHQSH